MVLTDRVRAIPGEDGFWESHTEDEYLRIASLLNARGFSDNEIVDLLDRLYHATSGEFGR
jgi:hypothetical protein